MTPSASMGFSSATGTGTGTSAFEAARLGVLVHGLAGDRASAAIGGLGMVAGDLPDAITAIMAQGRGA